MPTPPEARVTRLLQTTGRRLKMQDVARATAVAAGAAFVPFVISRRWWVAAAAAALAGIAYWWFTRRTRQHPAVLIEARVPGCHNLIVTADALISRRLHAKPAVADVVFDDAARCADRIDPSTLWPWLRPAVALGLAGALWAAIVFIPAERLAGLVPGVVTAASAPVVESVEVLVTPPSYTGKPAEAFTNPERIAVMAGSLARVNIKSNAALVTVATIAGRQQAIKGAGDVYSVELVIDTDGYVAITPAADGDRTGAQRLIGVTALPDRAPEVRITEPGKDMFLKSAATRPLPVRLQADDDIGLRGVRLVYTKVAGAGESFTFTEGEAPVTLSRTSDRQWIAAGSLPLESMRLDVGDMVVYRGLAVDGRPGATATESDAFIVEIVSESEAMAEGFSIDDRQDKYALSQQMVIIKTERLLAKASTIAKDALIEEALGIAAEQRSVRAEIVFMMGGEFEDEEVEAEHEHEISDGRTENSGRADLGVATRAMSRAASQLTDVDLKAALTSERAALVAMQRALSRRRFILRTLTQRGQIDDTRRLQGKLAGLGRGDRPVESATTSSLVTAARTALLAVMDVSKQASLTAGHAAQLSAAAATLLAAEGRGAPVVDVASRLSGAAEAIAGGTPDAARKALADASARLIAIASAELTTAPASASGRAAARLRGALADALRGGGNR